MTKSVRQIDYDIDIFVRLNDDEMNYATTFEGGFK